MGIVEQAKFNVLKIYAKKEILSYPYMQMNVKLFDPPFYPVITMYIRFNLKFIFNNLEESAIHFYDESTGNLFFLNFIDILKKELTESYNFFELILNVQLPEEISKKVVVKLKSLKKGGEEIYTDIGILSKEETYNINIWRFIPNRSSSLFLLRKEEKNMKTYTYLFVGGAAKSGTTYMEILLNSFQEILCIGEKGAQAVSEDDYSFLTVKPNDKIDFAKFLFPKRKPDYEINLINYLILQYWTKHYFDVTQSLRYIGDRTPFNSLIFDRLLLSLENSKYIHVVRHPLDVVVSRIFHEINVFKNNRELSYISESEFAYINDKIKSGEKISEIDLVKPFIKEWIEYNQHFVKICKNRVLNNRLLYIRYEDLIYNIDSVIDKLSHFLEIKLNDNSIRFSKHVSSFEFLAGRKRGEEDKTSFFRKGISNDWVNYIDERLISLLTKDNNFVDILSFFKYEL